MTTQHSAEPGGQWRLMLREVRRRWRTLLAFLLAGAVLAGGASLLLTQPRATTTVFVTPLDANPFSPDPRGQTLIDLVTEAQVAKSDAVLQRAAEKLGNRIGAARIDAATDVTVPVGSQVLAITVTGPDGVAPNEVSDAVAASYLEIRREGAQVTIDEQLTAIKAAEKAATAQIRRAARAIRASGAGTAERQVAEQQLSVATGTLATLADQRSALIVTPTSPGQVLSPGSASRRASPVRAVLAGALLGGALGATWIVVSDIRRRPHRALPEPVAGDGPIATVTPATPPDASGAGTAAGVDPSTTSPGSGDPGDT